MQMCQDRKAQVIQNEPDKSELLIKRQSHNAKSNKNGTCFLLYDTQKN